MATSQLGNYCKSKHDSDIKGMNDDEKNNGQREISERRCLQRREEGKKK